MLLSTPLLYACVALSAAIQIQIPRLVPVFTMTLEIQGLPQSLYFDKDQGMESVLGIVSGGNVTTIPNDLGLEAEIRNISGIDNLFSYKKKGHGNLNVNLHGTSTEGADVRISYKGVILAQEGVDAVLSGKLTSPADYYFSTSPTYSVAGNGSEILGWMEKENFITKGQFLSVNGQMLVQYIVFVIR